jgi:hypothetical protein
VAIADFFRKLRSGTDSAVRQTPVKAHKGAGPQPIRTTVKIDFDMMLKGSVYDRPTGRVRQYGVTVDGSTRVITSGDYVNRETYDALLKAGAIRARAETPPPDASVPSNKPRRNREAS